MSTIISVVILVLICALIFWLIEAKFPEPWKGWCRIGFAVLCCVWLIGLLIGEWTLPSFALGR